MLFAEGKESTIIRISESKGSNSNCHTATRTYSEINTFFLKALSNLLQKSVISKVLLSLSGVSFRCWIPLMIGEMMKNIFVDSVEDCFSLNP
jgi:hypothetical protein